MILSSIRAKGGAGERRPKPVGAAGAMRRPAAAAGARCHVLQAKRAVHLRAVAGMRIGCEAPAFSHGGQCSAEGVSLIVVKII
jgi:hypothetical protein